MGGGGGPKVALSRPAPPGNGLIAGRLFTAAEDGARVAALPTRPTSSVYTDEWKDGG